MAEGLFPLDVRVRVGVGSVVTLLSMGVGVVGGFVVALLSMRVGVAAGSVVTLLSMGDRVAGGSVVALLTMRVGVAAGVGRAFAGADCFSADLTSERICASSMGILTCDVGLGSEIVSSFTAPDVADADVKPELRSVLAGTAGVVFSLGRWASFAEAGSLRAGGWGCAGLSANAADAADSGAADADVELVPGAVSLRAPAVLGGGAPFLTSRGHSFPDLSTSRASST